MVNLNIFKLLYPKQFLIFKLVIRLNKVELNIYNAFICLNCRFIDISYVNRYDLYTATLEF